MQKFQSFKSQVNTHKESRRHLKMCPENQRDFCKGLEYSLIIFSLSGAREAVSLKSRSRVLRQPDAPKHNGLRDLEASWSLLFASSRKSHTVGSQEMPSF